MKLVLSFTNVERLFTTTNDQLLYLSPIAFYFCFIKSNFYPEKTRSRTNITPKSLLAPCQASTRKPQLKSGDFLTEILYSASSPTVSCKNFIRLYFKITSRFSPNAPKFIRPWVLLGYRDLCFTWSTLC